MVCLNFIVGSTVFSQAETSTDMSVPVYAGTLEHVYTPIKTEEQETFEVPLLYLLRGIETLGFWLDPANEIGLLPEAEGRFMMSSTPILQAGGTTVPVGIGVTGFAQPIVINENGIPQGFNENEYLYEQSLVHYDDTIEDIFQKVPYIDRFNYQYGVSINGQKAQVYRKSIERQLTLLAMLQTMGVPPELANAWVEEYARIAHLPQTLQLAWLIADNPLAGEYQSHIQHILESLNLSILAPSRPLNSGLHVKQASNFEWVNQDPFWVRGPKTTIYESIY